MSRVELRDGQWAELRERITHGIDKHLKKAIQRGKENPSDMWDVDTAIVAAFVRQWDVRDPDGQQLAVGEQLDGSWVERAPDDVVSVLARAATKAWTGATVPNAPTPPSSDG